MTLFSDSTGFGQYGRNSGSFLSLPAHQRLTYQRFPEPFGWYLVSFGLTPSDHLAAQVEKSSKALAPNAVHAQADIVLLLLNTAHAVEDLSPLSENNGVAG